MGELHLEVYVERMKREYGVACTTGKPQVAYREMPTKKAEFTFTHKKQTGGAGQFARISGYFEPMEKDPETGKDVEFENVVMSGNVPSNYIPAVEKVCKNVLLFYRKLLITAFRDSLRHYKKEVSVEAELLDAVSS